LESLKGRDHLKNVGVDGRVILKWGGTVRIGFLLAQDRDLLQILVNTVMNLQVL
jgi:hypothetical protein